VVVHRAVRRPQLEALEQRLPAAPQLDRERVEVDPDLELPESKGVSGLRLAGVERGRDSTEFRRKFRTHVAFL
jgi:hypothetical protein